METTFDGLLNKRVTLEQPAKGFRVAVDTVLLASAVPALVGQRGLDLGCGAGGAMLALACRVADICVAGLEIQPELAELCRRNIILNKFQGRLSVEVGDVAQLDEPGAFDHALMNPPYHDAARHDASDNDIKRIANTSSGGDLAIWIAHAAKALKPDGMLTMIHRADCLDDILAELGRSFGRVDIVPVLPTLDAPPKRVIVRARKGGEKVVHTGQPLILHGDGGRYTDEAESILRHAEPLRFH